MGQALLLWAKGYCREPRAIAVGQGLLPWATLPTALARWWLPWAKGYCRGQKAIAVGHGLLPCAKGAMAVRKGDRYCRGPRAIARRRWAIAVGKGLLPYIYTGKQRAGAVSKGLLP